MYLALIPDASSLAALKQYAPLISDTAHLTVIHVPVDFTDLPTPSWPCSLVLETKAVSVFGRTAVFGLKLGLSDELRRIREEAERILRAAGLPWSKQWPLSPHVTLGRTRAKCHAPSTLRFDRLEWR